MSFLRPALATSLSSLLVLLLLAARPALAQQNPDSITLSPFYRGMQLQGELFGMGLTTIPDYLVSPDSAFPYKKKVGFTQEIPFVDSFTINRLMGGYREDWLRKFGLVHGNLGRRSLDYVTKNPDGSLTYHPELIRERLAPYLAAGYTPADITLALDNTPWDLATATGRAPMEGAWGRVTPPGNTLEWSTVVRHFVTDLETYLGPTASQISFETGIEFDEKVSFDGTANDFFQYYKTTDEAIHAVLPGAKVSPGEFTGTGACPITIHSCVYDTKDFLNFTSRAGISPNYVPRSLHAFADKPNPWPSAVAKRAAISFKRLPNVPFEIHQFGLLFEPFGESEGADPGPMQANWEFQTLAHLIEGGAPRRVYHWGGMITIGKAQFLNGSGFLRLVLDHYVGRHILALPIEMDSPANYEDQVVAIALTSGAPPAMMISSFSPKSGNGGSREVTVGLPPGLWTSGWRPKFVAYSESNNVFASVRKDLASDGNLKPDFAACPLCLGNPIIMASDPTRARIMIARNWARYHAEMAGDLRWVSNGSDISISDQSVKLKLDANELIIIEPVSVSH